MAVWSYLEAHHADPGVVPKRWQDFVRSMGDALPVVPALPEWQPGKATFCRRCDIPRPERAHHCIICGVCVLRLDHHCPWINNCVGFRNHKFFLLLGVYACLASYVALLTSLSDLIACVCSLVSVEDGFSSGFSQEHPELPDMLAFLIFGFLALFIVILLTPMLMAHLPLATMNLTTIEGNYMNMPNPFEQGRSKDNLAQILGSPGVDWLLPVQPWRPLTDGVSFEHFYDRYTRNGQRGQRALAEADPDIELEDLWRARYGVRFDVESPENDVDTFSSLSRLWSCSRSSA
jgi:palmitoyltransferase